MKKIKKSHLFFSLSLVFFLSQLACTPLQIMFNSGFKKPEVRFKDVKHISTTGLETQLEVVIGVRNKNNYDVKVDSLKYETEVNGKPLAHGDWREGVLLPANEETLVSLPLELQIFSAGPIIATLLSGEKKALEVHCHGTLVVDPGLFWNLDFPFDEKQTISF